VLLIAAALAAAVAVPIRETGRRRRA